MFYAELRESMKVSEGPARESDRMKISLIRVPFEDASKLVLDENLPKSAAFTFSLYWYLNEKLTKK